MILNPKATNVAYRCPSCGYIVRGVAGSFGLGAQDMLRLRCTCGTEAEMTILGSADHRIRLTVPCLLCGKEHHYTLSDSLFYGKDVFHLSCPYTDLDVGFFGRDEGALAAATEKSTEELNTLYEELVGKGAVSEAEEECDSALPDDEEPFLPDAQIYDIVRFMVKELEADGKIHCPCAPGEYDVEMTSEGIRVYCRLCGADYLFSTNSVSAAQEFLSCEGLELRGATE